MSNNVTNIQLKGHRRAFNNLRSCNERSIVAAWRYGQVVDALVHSGFTYEELGEDVDRKPSTVKLYQRLYLKYGNEKDVLEVAEAMKTWSVSRLAGHSPLVPVQYVLCCINCGSNEIKKTKKTEDDTSRVVSPASGVIMPSFGFGTAG